MAASTSGAAPERPARDPDTFPRLLLNNVERFGDRDALREKEYGIWQVWTWQRLADQVRTFACGLAALGFKRGDKLAVIGDNRPRLYAAMTAAQSLGGIPVPMYQDAVAKELQFVLEHAEARFLLAENQEQVDKILELKEGSPALETMIYDDPRGMRHYEHPFFHAYHEVEEQGRRFDQAHPDFWLEEVGKGAGDDVAIMLYTSGTTGNPKGVVLTQRNLIVTARNAAEFEGLRAADSILAYLPMAWVGDNIFSIAQSYLTDSA